VTYLDSPAWRTVMERAALPGALVANRWSGVAKRSFAEEEAERLRAQAIEAERRLAGALTLADLENAVESLETVQRRARGMLAQAQAQGLA
jgi:hypothetical protein